MAFPGEQERIEAAVQGWLIAKLEQLSFDACQRGIECQPTRQGYIIRYKDIAFDYSLERAYIFLSCLLEEQSR